MGGSSVVALLETALSGLPRRRGKVRDVYDLGDDRLLIVATDRISAFDWVLPNGIPDKGRILTGISAFWFGRLGVPHHLISTDIGDAGLDLPYATRQALTGRSMVVAKADVIPFECVVRGYLSGSGWREYKAKGTICGERLPAGLVESARIDPLFTPATKAETGHDENIPFARMDEALDSQGLAKALRAQSLEAYEKARTYAESRGLILADTKFEFGFPRGGGLSCSSMRCSPPTARATGPRRDTGRAGRSRRSTSSSCATGSTRPAGTRPARPHHCRTRSSPGPARSTSKRTGS